MNKTETCTTISWTQALLAIERMVEAACANNPDSLAMHDADRLEIAARDIRAAKGCCRSMLIGNENVPGNYTPANSFNLHLSTR